MVVLENLIHYRHIYIKWSAHTDTVTLRDSLWFPQSRDQASVLLVVSIMVVAHHSSLLGLMDAGLLFGWLPIQLTYDIAYLLVGVGILVWIARKIPDPTEEYASPTRTEEKKVDTPVETTED